MRYIVIVILPLLMLGGCAQKAADDAGEIVIGFNADQSGGGTIDHGISAREGFEIAIDEINAKGGLLGKKIRPVIMDDKENPDISEKNMRHLIFDEGAIAVIGPSNSGNALRWMPLAQENHVIIIIPVSTATILTQKYMQRPDNYIFRVSVFDKDQTRMYIPWVLRKTPHDRVAIIHDDTGFGQQGVLEVAEGLARWGITPVAIESFSRNDDYETLKEKVRAVRDAGAEAVELFCLSDSSGYLLKAIDETPDFDPIVFGPWSNAATDIWKIGGTLAEDFILPSSTTVDQSDRTKELYRKIVERYGEPAPLFTASAQGYDAIMLLAKAIENAGSLDRAMIRDELEDVRDVQGVIKLYDKPFSRYDHEALSGEDFFLAHWENGTMVAYHDEATSGLEIR